MLKQFRQSSQESGPVFILGLGRFGRALGAELIAGGVEVLGVDADSKIVQEVCATFDHVVTADTTNPEVLRQLGIEESSRVVIAIGRKIENSLLTASAVVDMNVASVWAKADNDAHAKILRQIGVHHVIRPEADSGRRVAHLMGGRLQDYLEFDRDFAVAKIAPPVSVLDRTVEDIHTRTKGKIQILALRDPDGCFHRAENGDVVRPGSLIIVAGRVSMIEDFAGQS